MLPDQKQLGVYYTQEDIAEYISKNTIIPFILSAVEHKCPAAFAPDGPVWSLLRENPDHYIYDALKQGCALPLPPEIQSGIHDLAQRTLWNTPAPEQYALPMENWREVIARRQRYGELKKILSNGKICAIHELVTYNLDVRIFVQEVIVRCERADLLGAFYESMEQMTILDPTCGSGAFLLASLDVLEPLYATCLEWMQSLIEQDTRLERADLHTRSLCCLKRFREVLSQAACCPNRGYFISRTILTHNLYGVDIMQEAVENCRRELALRLGSQVESPADSAALPGGNFNIRTGNALVGYISAAEILTVANPSRTELDSRLATEYGLEQSRLRADYAEEFAHWRESHRPFHWCLEFQEVMQNGGFDIVIGNPPFVAYRKVTDTYQVVSYATSSCGNLCAYTLERALKLLRAGGRCGMIVPVSTIASERYQPLSRLLFQRRVWVSSYSNRPGKLFASVEQRLAILLVENARPPILFSSPYRRWYGAERVQLFKTLAYTRASVWARTGMPLKSGTALAEAIFARLVKQQGFPALHCSQAAAAVWVHNGPTYWVRALPFEPNAGCKSTRSNHYRKVPVNSQRDAFLLAAVLSSSTFYFFYTMISNCRDLGRKELQRFPLGELRPALKERLVRLGRRLAERLKATAMQCSRQYPSGGIAYEEYYPLRAKDLLDKIDRVLAEHYGLSAEELDFIVNYDLKYRMGREHSC